MPFLLCVLCETGTKIKWVVEERARMVRKHPSRGVVPALRSQCGTETGFCEASARKKLLQVFTCIRAI